MKKKDRIGFEDEFIKVLEVSPDEVQIERNKNIIKKDVYYRTLCKRCNNIWDLRGTNVGKVKSCGCYMKTKWKDTAKNHIGEKYNSLTLIDVDWEKTEYERNKTPSPILDTFYFTQCDCGKISKQGIRYNSIKCGHTKSCGCIKFDNPLIIEDLTGLHNNRLTVIRRDIERDKQEQKDNGGIRSGNAHWLCQCDCGNPELVSATGWQIKTGGVKSCGCFLRDMLIERNKRDSSKYNHHGKLKDNTPLFDENNQIRIYDEDMNFSFLISKEDYDDVSKYYWRKITEKEEPNPRKRYWVTNEKVKNIRNGSQTTLRLHQIVAKNKFGEYDKSEFMPDHLNRNPDDNTRENLILKTNMDNSHNRGLSRKNKSGKTGVYWSDSKQCYQAYITVNYKNISLGYFAKDEYDAAVQARIEAEKKYGFTCDDIYPDSDTENIS